MAIVTALVIGIILGGLLRGAAETIGKALAMWQYT
jgi:hypothetical protein